MGLLSGREGRAAQMSLEHVMLVAFAIAVLLPGIYFFYTYTQAGQATLSGAQYAKIGEEVIDRSREVLAQGAGTWLKLDVMLPENIRGFNISDSGSEIVFSYDTASGRTEAVFFIDDVALANGTGKDGTVFLREPHSGQASFRFTASQTGYVLIQEHYG